MEIMSVVFLIIGLAIGFLLGWLIKKNKSTDQSVDGNISAKLEELTKENGNLNGRLENASEVFKEQKQKLEVLSSEKESLIANISHWKAVNENLESKLTDQKKELEEIQEKFSKEFELIANRLLKQNSSELAESNQKRLGEILNPLKENIKQFGQKVEDKYEKELKERTSLLEQIKTLKDLNVQMSEDAQSLTRALKGDSKAQGNWGELILEKVLESSGLIKGEEYETQHSTVNDEGNRVQPDVIVKLPENKHIVIDSKVSLTAYEKYVDEEDQETQEKALKEHVLSVKNHIKGLSEKNYATAYGINSPDFVLLFMPIESSFGLAIRADNTIYQFAWDKKVVIVGPSTLLATLRTIASVWKQERQTKNAIEIARQAGALHDKFVGFVDDMAKIKSNLDKSSSAYNDAFNKLKTGKGNLIDATVRLEKLGAKTKKNFPGDLLDNQDLIDEA